MSRVVFALGALAVAAGCGGAEGARQVPAPAEGTGERMSFTDALAAAQERHPDAVPIEVHIETEENGELMEVALIVEGEVREVYMDPVSGAHVKEETEELDEEAKSKLPVLEEKLATGEASLERSIELAESKYDPAAIQEIELEIHGEDQLVLEVGVEEDGETVEYVLDPQSGEVQGRETDDETHEVEESAY